MAYSSNLQSECAPFCLSNGEILHCRDYCRLKLRMQCVWRNLNWDSGFILKKTTFPSWCNVLCTCLVNYFRILTSFQLNVLNMVTKQFIDKNKNNAKETCLCVVVFVALSKKNTLTTMPTIVSAHTFCTWRKAWFNHQYARVGIDAINYATLNERKIFLDAKCQIVVVASSLPSQLSITIFDWSVLNDFAFFVEEKYHWDHCKWPENVSLWYPFALNHWAGV